MLRSIRVAAVALALFHVPAAAFAAESAAAKAAPSAKALDCAFRYNKAMHLEDTMAGMMKSLMPALLAQYRAEGVDTAALEPKLVEAMVESSTAMTPKMMDRLAPVMASTFTEAEVCGLAEFYESPVGQKVVAKMPAFSAASAGVMAEVIPAFQKDMLERICRKIDCNAAATPVQKAS